MNAEENFDPTPTPVNLSARTLIDPEDLIINTTINERGYPFRCSVNRRKELLEINWLEIFCDITKPVVLMQSVDEVSQKTDVDSTELYGTYVFDLDNAIAIIYISNQGSVYFHFWGSSWQVCKDWVEVVKENLFTYKTPDVFDEKTLKRTLTFWGQQGQEYANFDRKVTLLDWDQHVNVNYPPAVQTELESLRNLTSPITGGKILLFHGPPGTGKTSLIRALAAQWSKWCHTSYIMDPDVFFAYAGSMMSVVTWDYDRFIDADIKKEDAYHLIIIEDADEMINQDAQIRGGQSVSRLLNIADGLLGQSTNLLICITTNVEMQNLNTAVSRAGRCLAKIHFDAFTKQEAENWCQTHYPDQKIILPPGLQKYTLADLYQASGNINQIALQEKEYVTGTYL